MDCGDPEHNDWINDGWPCPVCTAISVRNRKMKCIKSGDGYNGLGCLLDLLETIKKETVPMPGHSDPKAIDDVWNSVFEELDAIYVCEGMQIERMNQLRRTEAEGGILVVQPNQ